MKNPLNKISSLLLIGLALSIGWGIRGNFGHEYGAAFAGSLAAIAAAMLSGRADWREKIPYFAFFGAIGWGFGASVSYMQVLSYTESGHFASQLYGYFCVFVIGFLWAGMGSAGTGFAAAASTGQIVKIFKPILFVFGAWLLLDMVEDPISHLLESGIQFDENLARHKNPLYWFDADYLPALFAVAGAAAYDLFDRKGEKNRLYLPVFAVSGAATGFLVQFLLRTVGIENRVGEAFTYLQGDPSYINPTTGMPAYEASNLLNNWPQWFGDYPQHIGWFIGLILGIMAYFFRFGKFRNGASLPAWMGIGWLISFLLFPVLGSIPFEKAGGLRMTPPRSDDWAGIVGVFTATSLWMWRNNLKPVTMAMLKGGIIGGLGFSGIQWLKQLFMSAGSPRIAEFKGILPGSAEYLAKYAPWANWQAQNWHSFLEQSYGFVNGIAIALIMIYLSTRVKPENNEQMTGYIKNYRWTKAFAALFILLGLTYFNVVKNVAVWSEQLNPEVWQQSTVLPDGSQSLSPAHWDMPYLGRLPGFGFLSFTPVTWFNITWLALVIACVIIVYKHFKKPLAVFPSNALARGQIIFLILLWVMVVANFERALTGWHPSRLLTEWVIFINAIIATVLILILPIENIPSKFQESGNMLQSYRKQWIKALGVVIVATLFFTFSNRLIYHYPEYQKLNKKTYHTRFGPEASWRSKPNLKNAEHK